MNMRLEDIVDLKELPEQFSVQCPFCPPHYQDGKTKLGISLSKNVYHCWRCNAKGKASELFLRFTGINKMDLLNFSFEKKDFFQYDPNKELLKSELVAYDALSNKILENNLHNAKNYLNNRAITDEEIKYYDIRTAKSNNLFRNRIMIPTFDKYGNCVYFVARDYVNPNNKVKYLNALDTHKAFCVWNLNNSKENGIIAITEGVFSGISANKIRDQLQDFTAVSIFGKFISKEQAKLISNAKPKEVIISLDGDVSDKEVKKNIDILKYYYTGLITRIKIPDNKDPNDISTEEYKKLIDNRVKI